MTPRCRPGDRRFTVLRVNGNPSDTHAARSFEEALEMAQPGRNSIIEVFRVCAPDAGAARFADGQFVKRFRYKRGG